MIKLLTQDNCGQCVALAQYLKLGLKGAYDDKIEVVKREDQPELFMDLAKKYQIRSTPALVSEEGDVLQQWSPSKVSAFLKTHCE